MVWYNIHSNSLNLKIQSSLWETTHRNCMCAYAANIMFKESAQCKLCLCTQLTRTHIFMNCETILKCYQHFLTFCDSLVSIGSVDLIERAFGLKVNDGDIKSSNYINFSLRHVTYRSRYKILGKSKEAIQLNLIKKISLFIRTDLRNKFEVACAKNEVESFKRSYLIDCVLGEVIDGNLVLKDLVLVM